MKLNEEEFNERFLENSDMIYSLGMRLFRNMNDEASDFVQDVYLRARKKKDQYSGQGKFGSWLYRLALNHGLNLIKKKKRTLLQSEFPDTAEIFTADYREPSADLADAEISGRVREKLALLPEAQRLCLVLYYFEEMSYEQIAEHLSMKTGTVKSHIHRARVHLRSLIGEEGKQYV